MIKCKFFFYIFFFISLIPTKPILLTNTSADNVEKGGGCCKK